MLYVLAGEGGSLYLYDRDGVFHNGDLTPGQADRRHPGARVIVFERAAEGGWFRDVYAPPGSGFHARPARPGDALGATVCLAAWWDDGEFAFHIEPTPADALGEAR